MLGLFGRKSDHPLADPKSAQQLMSELPKNDTLKTVQEITGWLESVRADENFRLDEQFAALRLLDETARPYERKLTRELYASTSLSRFQENRLWAALNEFYVQLSDAYGEVLIGCRDGDKGSAALKPLLPLINARAIQAASGRLKCAAVRYLQPDPEVWALLAVCYGHAEAEKYVEEPVALYPGLGAIDSVRCQFTSALLWWISGTGTLQPQQVHLAERLTAHLCRNYTVQVQPVAGTLLSFNVTQPRPPLRYTGEGTVHPGQRFVSLGTVQAQLESIIKTLDKGMVPDDINLGGTYEAGAVLAVARHLAEQWSSPPPMRRAPRRSISVNLHVAGGFAGVIEQTEVGLNFSSSQIDRWEIEEISSNGFRCVLPAARATEVRIGLLLGIQPENVAHWGAAVVRRLGRDGDNNLQIGVEMLASRLQGVALREGSMSLDDEPALWLVRSGDDGEAWLLMKPDTFSINRSLHMHVQDRKYLLMPLALVEKGEDYDFARFRKIEQDAAGEAEAY